MCHIRLPTPSACSMLAPAACLRPGVHARGPCTRGRQTGFLSAGGRRTRTASRPQTADSPQKPQEACSASHDGASDEEAAPENSWSSDWEAFRSTTCRLKFLPSATRFRSATRAAGTRLSGWRSAGGGRETPRTVVLEGVEFWGGSVHRRSGLRGTGAHVSCCQPREGERVAGSRGQISRRQAGAGGDSPAIRRDSVALVMLVAGRGRCRRARSA